MTYEQLLDVADLDGLAVKEHPLINHNGLIKGKRIAIRKNISTQAEKSCVLAEELGHHYTTSGNILDQSSAVNRKQEQRARFWAYNRQIGLIGIIEAWKHGCRTCYEMAKFLGVTEAFLSDALQAYRNKYGVCKALDHYLIYFYPNLTIVEFVNL